MIRRFLSDQSGATAIEYGLIAAMMTVVIIAMAATGGTLDTLYEWASDIVDAIAGDGGGEEEE